MSEDRSGATARRWGAAIAAAAAATVLLSCAPTEPEPALSLPTPSSQSAPPSTVPPLVPPPTSAPPTRRPATVHTVTTSELGATWRPGCPAGPELLRRVELDYLGLDGLTHRGSLVVHKDLVPQVITVFDELYRLHYPIDKMRTVDHYPGAEDELSMRDNNTSAFNCRGIPGSGSWSWHAYGRAIDLNPLFNPYIDSAGVQPANAGPYVDRTRTDPGLLHAGDPAVRAFTDRGWRWGGYWRSPIDYQHFELR